jgi:hypothetical protein
MAASTFEIKRREKQQEEISTEDTQRLVTETEILKVVLHWLGAKDKISPHLILL